MTSISPFYDGGSEKARGIAPTHSPIKNKILLQQSSHFCANSIEFLMMEEGL